MSEMGIQVRKQTFLHYLCQRLSHRLKMNSYCHVHHWICHDRLSALTDNHVTSVD